VVYCQAFTVDNKQFIENKEKSKMSIEKDFNDE